MATLRVFAAFKPAAAAAGAGRRAALRLGSGRAYWQLPQPAPAPRSLAAQAPCRQRQLATIVAKAQAKGVSSNQPDEGDRVKGILQLALAGIGVSVLAASGGALIADYSTPNCLVTHTCESIPLFMKVPLVATHFFTFILIPATMYVFFTRSQALKDVGAQDPFTAMVGLSYIAVAIAGEMGWHVTQQWFYQEDYSILNFMFYFFLMLGTSLWAIGIKEDDTTTSKDEYIDNFLLATPWLAGLAYLAGELAIHTKVPIYILLSIQYAVLTYRFWNLLKTPKVFLFPLFSVGVNLFFIAQLNIHREDPILNPLFHILHDAAGTELGVAIIAILLYLQLPANAEGPKLR